MTESEDFLSRWSRRKQEAKSEPAVQADAPEAALNAEAEASTDEAKLQNANDQEPQFDLSTLPPIESIGAGTDIKLFLQKGVPLELTRAALRRAWTSDPAIRDFIEVAENQWDFATGEGLPGFGPLKASDDVRRLLAELFEERPSPVAEAREVSAHRESERDQEDRTSEAVPPAVANEDQHKNEASARSVSESEIVQRKEENAALQQEPKQMVSNVPFRRGHGRALPQ